MSWLDRLAHRWPFRDYPWAQARRARIADARSKWEPTRTWITLPEEQYRGLDAVRVKRSIDAARGFGYQGAHPWTQYQIDGGREEFDPKLWD